MLNQTVSTDTSALKGLATPGIMRQIVELFTGSIRRDALHAIRTSDLSHWSYNEEGKPSVMLDHPECKAHFVFVPMGRSKANRLESLSLASDKGAPPPLPGESDTAQRLLRYAQKQLNLLTARQKKETVALFNEVVSGAPLASDCSCTYERHDVHDHDREHSNDGWSKRAVFFTPHGSIELTRELRTYEIKGERGREMMHYRINASIALDIAKETYRMERQGPFSGSIAPLAPIYTPVSNDYYTMPPYLHESSLPPLPCGVVDAASATFVHTSLEHMLALMNGPRPDVIFPLNTKQIERALETMKLLAR
jgi:hypothetical protein